MAETTLDADGSKLSLWSFFLRAPLFTKLRIFVLVVLGWGVLACSSFVVYQIVRLQRSAAPATPAAAHVEDVAKAHREATHAVASTAPAYTYTYELKNFALSLTNRDRGHLSYAQFTLVLDLPNEASKKWIELNRSRVTSVLFEVGHRFHREDFRDAAGFEKFKRLLKEAYRESFKEYSPRDLAIRDWVLN